MTASGGPIAVTGASGRLGRAIIDDMGSRAVPWHRPDLDLDRPASAGDLVARDRPSCVIHAAAMTAVDECARHPDAAMRRNGDYVGALAEACVGAGVKLVLVSTNEVFDGDRTDGLGYAESDSTRPRNPYGASKRAGELAAEAVFDGREGLWIVRTAWLYGPPGNDFPDKIVAAADRLPDGEALPVVSDEHGSPTCAADLAAAIAELTGRTLGGVYHLVNTGQASRATWAEQVLHERRPGRKVRPISRSEFVRASDPPPWGVLDGARAAAAGISMQDWTSALSRYLDAAGRVSRPSA